MIDSVELSEYERRRVGSGDLIDAIHTYMHRVGCQMHVARRVVYAEHCRVHGLLMSDQKFVGYHEESELPIKPGMTVTIRKGTIVKTVGREPKPAGRNYKVTVHHILPGVTRHRDFRNDQIDFVNPSVCWPGPGGYWSEADINSIPEATGLGDPMLVDCPQCGARAGDRCLSGTRRGRRMVHGHHKPRMRRANGETVKDDFGVWFNRSLIEALEKQKKEQNEAP